MKVIRLSRNILFFLAAVFLATGCEEESNSNSITLTSGSVVELYPVANQSQDLVFESSGEWTATCLADWVSFSPKKGSSGKNTIKVTTAVTNKTKSTRSTSITIRTGAQQRNVTVVQSGKYAIFDQKTYTVSAEGGKVRLSFKSNLEQSDNLQIRYSQQSWINWPNGSRLTRAEWSGKTEEMTVSPNLTNNNRTAVYLLTMPTSDGQWMGLDTAYVTQSGIVSEYESKDFTADGTVTVLQQATAGKGIPIVLMGDGFADKDISDNTYSQVMEKAMENIFSEEPAKSLRDYFNVYAVTAVSKSDGVGADYHTVFSTVPSDIDPKIEFDADKVDEYTKKVAGIDFENTLSVVIVNSNKHNGVTSLLFDQKTRKPRQRAIALCTLIDGANAEEFRQVLVHEAIGHGLAKLADEYGYDDKGPATDNTVKELQFYHSHNWMLNVDGTDDKSNVMWKDFIGDSRFGSESISVYEGGFTYAKGIFRPTVESMMRQNQSPFNAPSRKAIYDRIMLLGEDKEASTLDEFATFDEQHKPTRWNYATTRAVWQHKYLAPPVIVWTK
ncbi:MAG: hypothetical protein IKQ58_07600 [Prevotella sp.]|nr:hypothetical protein [Prevotella sp.]